MASTNVIARIMSVNVKEDICYKTLTSTSPGNCKPSHNYELGN